jgi:hypothetical protein
MNLGKFRELIGTVVILRPRPKVDGAYLKESVNSWIILDEVEKNQFLLKNTITNHEFRLTPDNIREFRSPGFVILAGQTTLKEGGAVEFEPFAPGLKESESLTQLTDEATRPSGNSVYQALKPYEGMAVTLRFPEKGDWKYGDVDATLDKCTQNYIVVRRAEFESQMPGWMASLQTRLQTGHIPAQLVEVAEAAIGNPRTIPEQAASIPMTFVSVAEDLDHKRPMIVFDYSFWEREGL